MYSGSTITFLSGRVMGVHQKIDRIARKQITQIVGKTILFPGIGKILHFEGKNGPDAIKRKSPAHDEPWHFYSPFDDDDAKLIKTIRYHYDMLVEQLKNRNNERAAFEAAWLAHALVDGLTPAHHYPYEEKLIELHESNNLKARNSVKNKLIIPGTTPREMLKKNWKMWGPRGLMTTHGLFEMGIAMLVTPLTFSDTSPSKDDIDKILDIGVVEWFKRSAREIAVLDMYKRYYRGGWSTKLTIQVRHKLMPTTIQMVSLAWLVAMVESGITKINK